VEATFHIEKIEGIAPPLKQISSGVAPHDVICNEGLVLIEKISKNTVACVKPSTAEQLALRGWGTIVTEV
jgi:hypothetical protein